MSVTRAEVLNLYKQLLHYSKSLTFTDVKYYKKRITQEFKENKSLTQAEDISYAFKVIERPSAASEKFNSMISQIRILHRQLLPQIHFQCLKHTIDYSKVPKINECDLAEQFIRGSGPGGSAVNKNSNCVVLTHIPTGTVIKCHTSRCQEDNRKVAREMLIQKLDEMLNGENSVTAQKKRIDNTKYKKSEYKKKKMAKLKEEWRKREGLV